MKRLLAWFGDKAAPERDDQAATWALLRSGEKMSARALPEFERWVLERPENADDLADAEGALALLDVYAGTDELADMRRRALVSAPDTKTWPGLKIAAVLVAAIGLSVASIYPWKLAPDAVDPAKASARPQAYTTAIGERATIALPDGSVATLDTNSSMLVNYDHAERGIRLLRGQAVFEVAKHQPLPFQVYALGQRITAVGTKFNVRIDRSILRVAMLEGQVVVRAQARSPSSVPTPIVRMGAGEALFASPGQPLRVVARDTEYDASWKDGSIVFRNVALADAVAEINRYTANPVQLDGQIGASLRVSGAFQTRDPEHFARIIAELFQLNFKYSDEGHIVLSEKK